MARFINNRAKATGKIPGSIVHLGTRRIEKTKLRLIDFTPEKLFESEFENLEDCIPYLNENTVSWLNIDGLHDAEMIQKLGELFDIHGILLEDMLNTGQRPKIAETDKLMVLILKILEYDENTNKLHADQVSFILDDNYLITLQEKESTHFEAIRERIRKGTGRVRRKSADYLTYLLLDSIADNYLINIEILGNLIEKTEIRIFADKPPKNLMQVMYKHKTEINFLRKNIRPVKEIVHHMIENESGFIADDNMKYFHDLDDLIEQASETIEIYQTMLNDQMNIYHANMGNKANEIMKVLTIFSAFFIPLTFMAGVYGMNFDYFPELHLKFGYLYFWLLMIAVTIGLIVYFRKRKWF